MNDIDISAILLNGTIPVNPDTVNMIRNYDGDDILYLTVKFDRTMTISYIDQNFDWVTPERAKPLIYAVNLMVTGNLNCTTPFEGSDTIRVLKFLKGQPKRAIIGNSL